MIRIDADMPDNCFNCFCCDEVKGECNILHSQIPLTGKLKTCPIKEIKSENILQLHNSNSKSLDDAKDTFVCGNCMHEIKEIKLAGNIITSPKYCEVCGSIFHNIIPHPANQTTAHFHRFPYGSTANDCTMAYCVVPTNGPFTLSDLIADVLYDIGTSEWGQISVEGTEYKLEYKHGAVTSENMPNTVKDTIDLLNKHIIGINARGGYSSMDYRVTLED